MKEFIEKLISRLEETDFNDIQMIVREVLLKYGFPYESVVQDEVWDALDELSTNKFAISIINQLAEEYNNGWIPCEKEMPPQPEENPEFEWKPLELYMVAMKGEKYPFRAFWNGRNFTDGISVVKPIAWKPLDIFQKGENK